MTRLDAGVFQDRLKSLLPQFREHFERAQDETGVEWRLLAAISIRNHSGTCRRQARPASAGLMQLTEETARHLGAVDRLDPQASISAGARYVGYLKDKLPPRIQEPDRTWLALAAYNIGIAHLEDARILAQKQKLNPDCVVGGQKDAAAAGPARILRGREVRLRARRHAGSVRRSGSGLLRHLCSCSSRLEASLAHGLEIDNPPVRSEEPALGNR